jgi:hypothetical protein
VIAERWVEWQDSPFHPLSDCQVACWGMGSPLKASAASAMYALTGKSFQELVARFITFFVGRDIGFSN